MRERPLGFSDRQMRQLQRAAATLPVNRRDEFLRAVAQRLGSSPSDHAVEAAINLSMDRQVTTEHEPPEGNREELTQ